MGSSQLATHKRGAATHERERSGKAYFVSKTLESQSIAF